MAFQTIPGESRTDFIGTDGVDILLSLNTGAQSVVAAGGDDLITLDDFTGVVGSATVRGGDGDDTINVGDTADLFEDDVTRLVDSSINGGAGDDNINTVGAVSSTIRGNEGEDIFQLEGNYTASVINGNSGGDVFRLLDDTQLENSKIVGGNDNDGQILLTGETLTAVNSTINGNKGNDGITIGGEGEVLTATDFTVFGGQGDDLITNAFAAVNGVVTYSGDKGDDFIFAGIGDAVVNGGDGEDTLLAGTGDDTIDGGAGDDTIIAGAGDDLVSGGDGDDFIDFLVDNGTGTDTISGGNGDDTIYGGAGSDLINGGAGDDVVFFDNGIADVATGGAGGDDFYTEDGLSQTFIFNSISDSAASNNFDIIDGGIDVTDRVDITAFVTTLAGSRSAVLNLVDEISLDGEDEVTDFGDLKTAILDVNGPLTPSLTGLINAYIVTDVDSVIPEDAEANDFLVNSEGDEVTALVILNDTNAILTGGDFMIGFTGEDGAQDAEDFLASMALGSSLIPQGIEPDFGGEVA